MVLDNILERPLYHKGIKPVNLKGNQLLTPAVSAEASIEGLQVERMDASTAKVPNHGSSKQRVCSSRGGSSERLKALCTLGPLIQHCILPCIIEGQGRGILDPGGGEWPRNPLGPPLTKYDWKGQSRRIWQRAGDWGVVTKGNQLCVKYLTQTPLEEKPSDKYI